MSFLLLGGKALGKPFMSRQYTCMSQSIRCSALHPLASRRSTAPPGADILGLRPMLSLLTGASRNTRSNAPEWMRDLIDLADFGIGFVKCTAPPMMLTVSGNSLPNEFLARDLGCFDVMAKHGLIECSQSISRELGVNRVDCDGS